MSEKTCKFTEILVRTNKQIKEDRAERITASAIDGVKLQLMNKRAAIRSIDDRIDDMLDMSTSPNLSKSNRVNEFDGANFTSDLVELRIQRKMAQIELDEALAIAKEFFGVEE